MEAMKNLRSVIYTVTTLLALIVMTLAGGQASAQHSAGSTLLPHTDGSTRHSTTERTRQPYLTSF
jgi:hypothetical protein